MSGDAPLHDGADGAAHFVAKWLAAEPEMEVARLFCPARARARFDAWGALLHALQQARSGPGDAGVAAAKTAWWSDELRALASGAPRHPLTRALRGVDAPWLALARALSTDDGANAGLPGDAQASLGQLGGLAAAAAAVEAALFGASADEAAARALAVHWRLHALPAGLASAEAAGLPMDLLARHALTHAQLGEALPRALLRDWARALHAALPASVGAAALPTQARLRFDRLRLARLAARGDVFDAGRGPALAWLAWRAGRAAARS